MVVSPIQFTLNAGDWSSISATVDVSYRERRAQAGFAAADDQVLLLGLAGNDFSRRRSLRRTMGHPLPDLHANQHASHRIRDHHGLRRQHNVSATTLLSVHPRAASITLSADASSPNPAYGQEALNLAITRTRDWATSNCVSQNNQVQYVATPWMPAATRSAVVPLPDCRLC